MIEGEHGATIIEGIVVLKTAAVVDGDVITTNLFSAAIAEAMRSGHTPREIAVSLWDALPGDDDWTTVVREKFEQAVDALEARGL